MRPGLTRRGWAVAALTVGCLLMANAFGARSLNAIVAPGVAALAAALVTVHRADRPDLERRLPADGFAGQRGTVELRVEGDRAGIYHLRDGVPDGLDAEPREHYLGDGSGTVSYELEYGRRGAHEFGTVAVELTDVLGLVRREISVAAGSDELLVYPELTAPPSAIRSAVSGLVDSEEHRGREEFERLREYDRGDALRDVHWKSSAKRPDDDLVVKEFHTGTPDRAVRIAAGARGSIATVDAVARATASVAVHLHDAGVDVGLRTPQVAIDPGHGPEHRRALLAALARLQSGSPAGSSADVRVTADGRTAVCTVGGRTLPFEEGAGSAAGERDRPRSTAAGEGREDRRVRADGATEVEP